VSRGGGAARAHSTTHQEHQYLSDRVRKVTQ
jgi:hypothetical protein